MAQIEQGNRKLVIECGIRELHSSAREYSDFFELATVFEEIETYGSGSQ